MLTGKHFRSCDTDIEMSAHFLLYNPNYFNERSIFLNITANIDGNIKKNDLQVTKTLLYGDNIQTI